MHPPSPYHFPRRQSSLPSVYIPAVNGLTDDRTEPISSPAMDSDTGTPSPEPSPAPAPPPSKKAFSGREDCWSADATATLIEAWGERYLELNRGSLRQNHWQEVADAVNAAHFDGSPRSRRSDVQCKNRIDTLKKKYKIEKARVSGSPSAAASCPWPFFSRLDALLGPAYPSHSRRFTSPATPAGGSHRHPTPSSWVLSSPVPVARRSFTQKRAATSPAPAPSGRSFSAFAAAVAAMEAKEDGDSERSRARSKPRGGGGGGPGDAAAAVAVAIEKLGEIYERVEKAKQRHMVELETQRMQFAKELECQRMQLFMETQLQLHRIKRPKRSPSTTTTVADDHYA